MKRLNHILLLGTALCVAVSSAYGSVIYTGSATFNGGVFSISVDDQGSTNYQITYTADFTGWSIWYPYIAGIEFRLGNNTPTASSLVSNPAGNWVIKPNNSSLVGGSLGTAGCQDDVPSQFICADDNHLPVTPTPTATPTTGIQHWVINATYTSALTPTDFSNGQIGALFLDSTAVSQGRPVLPLSQLPPVISKKFAAVAIELHHSSLLTFTVSNPNTIASLTNVQFTDPLPSGLRIATPAGVNNGCTGANITAAPGTSNIAITIPTLAPNASCTISLSVTGVSAGPQNNLTSAVSSDQSANGAPASATITVGDVFQVSYAANLAGGDSVVDLTSDGSLNGFEPAGNICANVYVFAEDQQLIACCSCPLTPDHLRTLSVRNDLISNTLTPGVPIGVTVALVASTSCNPSTVTASNLVAGLRGWRTTLHALPGSGYGVTENEFASAQLSASELAKLTSYCGFIQANGSGYGACGSCRAGAAGAIRQ